MIYMHNYIYQTTKNVLIEAPWANKTTKSMLIQVGVKSYPERLKENKL